ncbi:MAG: phosphotransferase family protein [Alkalibacterium gilvum]|uniref:phosphotransferase family protein n=1 Tax=Alkalibacterium TaxID=99906 RepID=UPI000EC49F49|nr:phosphotransferase family protein [Alkalibacterium sp.]MDN6343075.1 phosphotransferase family protein [Lactococcus lactis]MDN6293242.1 phosphotransferase family protein [Alkalibacterium sp.]MDN6294978.1 phosphotransferase family protein [Alkalibacterium sp.]MDN6397498.1 phosphotransferase family protein [Alkalibacterium sp.]HAJ69888.1 phosphotransferase [Alkalibacterium sp.]
MELERESGWQLHPIGGETGQAYMGTRDEERLFLKRNSSPFLAALSLEGISPKLVWTKRTGNGDVLTAQEWCNGRTLDKNEMYMTSVFNIIRRVHGSQSLKRMLLRLGGTILNPTDLYERSLIDLAPDLRNHPLINEALMYVKDNLPEEENSEEKVVCHGDISHKNLLLSNDNHLYLVDWDSVVISDSCFDVSQLMERYIDPLEWDSWLDTIEFSKNRESREKVYWYSMLNLLEDLKHHHKKQDYIRMNNELLKLQTILNQMKN